MILPEILRTAVVSGVVIAIIAYVADFFAGKAELGFPRQMIWIIAFAVWLLVVFFGGSISFR